MKSNTVRYLYSIYDEYIYRDRLRIKLVYSKLELYSLYLNLLGKVYMGDTNGLLDYTIMNQSEHLYYNYYTVGCIGNMFVNIMGGDL